jgi:hypothetical protein
MHANLVHIQNKSLMLIGFLKFRLQWATKGLSSKKNKFLFLTCQTRCLRNFLCTEIAHVELLAKFLSC